jgi:uncharacterized protein YbaR (Trm112 family)
MATNELLATLRCPENGSPLAPADGELIARLKALVAARQLRNRAGRTVEGPLDGGLVRAGGDVLYPIIDQIPVLLRDEAILLERQ